MDSINNASKFGGDAWLELQAFKTRQINRREKLNRHKDLINGITTNQNQMQPLVTTSSSQSNNLATDVNHASFSRTKVVHSANYSTSSDNSRHFFNEPDLVSCNDDHAKNSTNSLVAFNSSRFTNLKHNTNELPPTLDKNSTRISTVTSRNFINLEIVECLLLLKLCDVALKLPIDSKSLQRSICRMRGLENTSQSTIENLLEKFAHQELITIEEPETAIINKRKKQHGFEDGHDDETCIYVISADHTKLVEFDKTFGSSDSIRTLLIESRAEDLNSDELDVPESAKHGFVSLQNIRTLSNQVSSSNFNDRGEASLRAILGSSQQQEGPNCIEQPRHLNSLRKTSTIEVKKPLIRDDVESLLSLSSTRERESKKLGEELLELLSKPTAKEKNLLERFRSADGYQVQEFCPKGTKDECRRCSKEAEACHKLHFKKIIAKHTEESLGDCSFLNTCFHMDSCKYVHYEVDYDDKQLRQNHLKRLQPINSQKIQQNSIAPVLSRAQSTSKVKKTSDTSKDKNQSQMLIMASPTNSVVKYTLSAEEQARIDLRNRKRFKTVLYPPQWIQCDLRYFDMSLLGKFSVIMADPPWDIHMELPYGTMSDDEMRKLNIPTLQDEGVIFLWVTGRAMELGRECLALWGYERCDEIIWVKTNQLQRIIRTGRTGHWLNHGKEHCLVGIKGNPTDINRGLDCDIIVAEVRATSHKPDEIYGIIERLSPGTRKIELFGRAHNVQPNWITLGNQLNGVRLVEPNLIEAFQKLNLPYQTSDHVT